MSDRIQRRRSEDLRDDQDRNGNPQALGAVADLFYVVDGGNYPLFSPPGTVFCVVPVGSLGVQDTEGQLATVPPADAADLKLTAKNLGQGVPVAGTTIVKCDQIDGHLVFTYRGN